MWFVVLAMILFLIMFLLVAVIAQQSRNDIDGIQSAVVLIIITAGFTLSMVYVHSLLR